MRRHKLGKAKSKRLFTNTAKSTHPKNLAGVPLRGGLRL
ncbi:MAG: hypothetical protein [Microvirus sp.]|nr:MAG: hypothetical protein [Microvirus sp.]